jgi:hypothetical protein
MHSVYIRWPLTCIVDAVQTLWPRTRLFVESDALSMNWKIKDLGPSRP